MPQQQTRALTDDQVSALVDEVIEKLDRIHFEEIEMNNGLEQMPVLDLSVFGKQAFDHPRIMVALNGLDVSDFSAIVIDCNNAFDAENLDEYLANIRAFLEQHRNIGHVVFDINDHNVTSEEIMHKLYNLDHRDVASYVFCKNQEQWKELYKPRISEAADDNFPELLSTSEGRVDQDTSGQTMIEHSPNRDFEFPRTESSDVQGITQDYAAAIESVQGGATTTPQALQADNEGFLSESSSDDLMVMQLAQLGLAKFEKFEHRVIKNNAGEEIKALVFDLLSFSEDCMSHPRFSAVVETLDTYHFSGVKINIGDSLSYNTFENNLQSFYRFLSDNSNIKYIDFYCENPEIINQELLNKLFANRDNGVVTLVGGLSEDKWISISAAYLEEGSEGNDVLEEGTKLIDPQIHEEDNTHQGVVATLDSEKSSISNTFIDSLLRMKHQPVDLHFYYSKFLCISSALQGHFSGAINTIRPAKKLEARRVTFDLDGERTDSYINYVSMVRDYYTATTTEYFFSYAPDTTRHLIADATASADSNIVYNTIYGFKHFITFASINSALKTDISYIVSDKTGVSAQLLSVISTPVAHGVNVFAHGNGLNAPVAVLSASININGLPESLSEVNNLMVHVCASKLFSSALSKTFALLPSTYSTMLQAAMIGATAISINHNNNKHNSDNNDVELTQGIKNLINDNINPVSMATIGYFYAPQLIAVSASYAAAAGFVAGLTLDYANSVYNKATPFTLPSSVESFASYLLGTDGAEIQSDL